NTAERIEFAQVCTRYKKLHAAAARLCAEAFQARPELAEDLQQGHRYEAACAAALADGGQGADAAQLDEPSRVRWRQHALAWLRADLALWTKQLASGTPQARAAVQRTLQHWQQDPDLAGLREVTALAQLPAAERDAWGKLWNDVEALLNGSLQKGK